MDSLVSIIVPVYNVEEYIDKCVESIVNQTYKNLEIILVDDGSPDDCPQKCDAWAEKDNRIQVIHKKNAGLGFARNSGLDIAKGAYISFVDSDDYLDVNAIEVMIQRMNLDKSDLAVAKHVKIYNDGRTESDTYYWIVDRMITQAEAISMMGSHQALPVYAWGKLYKREIFNNLRYTQLTCAEDVYAIPEIITQCKRISLIDVVAYFYFQRDTSIVHTKNPTKIIDSMTASLHLSRFFLDHNYTKGASLYYYSALCQSFEIKNNKEAKLLLNRSFNKQERKLLRKGRDVEMTHAMIAAKFPSAYKYYKLHIAK